jgi:DNA-directed RNA polymerase subunit RPC12/RpoP
MVLNERMVVLCAECGHSFDWLKRGRNPGPQPVRCPSCYLRRRRAQTQASYERGKQRRKEGS